MAIGGSTPSGSTLGGPAMLGSVTATVTVSATCVVTAPTASPANAPAAAPGYGARLIPVAKDAIMLGAAGVYLGNMAAGQTGEIVFGVGAALLAAYRRNG